MKIMKMSAPVQYVLLAASFTTLMHGYGDDIRIPLDSGSIVVESPQFIRDGGSGRNVAGLTFTLTNHTSSAWMRIDLGFEITYACSGMAHQRSEVVNRLSVGWVEGEPIKTAYHDLVIGLVGKVDDCKTESIKATLISAINLKNIRFDGATGERIDLTEQERRAEQAKAAEAAEERAKRTVEKAAQDRIAAEEQAKEDAAEAARRKRLAAEQKKKDAELDARIAKEEAAAAVRAAEERRRVRAACAAIYQNTADKKLKDLTVKEEQRVRTCQVLGLYPPQ